MREILFRGKQVDADSWVEGWFAMFRDLTEDVPVIISSEEKRFVFKVIPETVGQFTGLTDRKGKKIFEGDILRYWSDYHKEYGDPCVVDYGDFNCSCCDGVYGWFLDGGDIRDLAYQKPSYEVIGNIHDHPELLEVSDGKSLYHI